VKISCYIESFYKQITIPVKQKYGQLALVAGASEGIGAAFSTYLAEAGMDLVMIARKKEPLEKFAASLADKHGIKAMTISCDLSEPGSVHEIKNALTGREVDMLVYNAALSFIGPFEKDTPEHCNQIANTNMITPLNLVRIFGEGMLLRKRGAVVLMASLAGFQGSGFLASYAATKAFNRVFAESLWYEWKGRGVDVIACCAGATSTRNYLGTNPGNAGLFAPAVQEPGEVVAECFRQLGRQPSFIAGTGNKVASFFMQRVLPRRRAINIMGDTTKKIFSI